MINRISLVLQGVLKVLLDIVILDLSFNVWTPHDLWTVVQTLIQRRAQQAFDGIYTMNPVVLMLSPQRWLDQGASDLQGVLRACSGSGQPY